MAAQDQRNLQAKEIFQTITSIKGANYARILKYNVSLIYIRKESTSKVAIREMTSMLAELSAVWGIDLKAPEYLNDLHLITKTLGVVK